MTPPAIHEIGRLAIRPFDTVTLDNGLQVHSILDTTTEICRLTLLLPGGEAESPLPGLFVLGNTLLAEGTRRHSGAEIADSLDFEGAWWGPQLTTHYSPLDFYSLSSKTAAIFDTAIEMLLEPVFPQEAIDNSLRQLAGRIEVSQRQASYLSACCQNRLLYRPDSALSRSASVDLLPQYTRELFVKAHASRLDPSQMHCCISGRLSDDDFARIVGRLAEIPAAEKAFEFKPAGFRDSYTDTRVDTPLEGSVQTSVRIAVPTIGRRHPDYIAVRFAVLALGGAFGSRLMSNIREEKALTYGINAQLSGYADRGFMGIACQTREPETVIAECEREIVRLADPASYTTDELTRLRRTALSSLASILDTPFSRMDFLQTRITADTPADYFEAQQQLALSLTPELLATAAATHLQGPRLISTAG